MIELVKERCSATGRLQHSTLPVSVPNALQAAQ